MDDQTPPQEGLSNKEKDMNTRTKIAVSLMAGLVASAAFVGTAYATPRAWTGRAYLGRTMMRPSARTVSASRPSIAEMNSFMSRYRTADGRVDVARMHDDVTSGRVAPPCLDGTGASDRGYGMMGSAY
ncbi:MAG: hypothetical protein WC971_04035 [Coriobacteriia bacterium]